MRNAGWDTGKTARIDHSGGYKTKKTFHYKLAAWASSLDVKKGKKAYDEAWNKAFFHGREK